MLDNMPFSIVQAMQSDTDTVNTWGNTSAPAVMATSRPSSQLKYCTNLTSPSTMCQTSPTSSCTRSAMSRCSIWRTSTACCTSAAGTCSTSRTGGRSSSHSRLSSHCVNRQRGKSFKSQIILFKANLPITGCGSINMVVNHLFLSYHNPFNQQRIILIQMQLHDLRHKGLLFLTNNPLVLGCGNSPHIMTITLCYVPLLVLHMLCFIL